MMHRNIDIYNRICRAIELLPVGDRKGAKVTLSNSCFNDQICVRLKRYHRISFFPHEVPHYPNIPLEWLLKQLGKPKFGRCSKVSMPKEVAKWWFSWYTDIDWSRAKS